MMQNTLLSNLSLNLNRMDKLQNQLSSGRKYGHISDDPTALIYGQAARNKLARLSHFQGAVETAQSWLTQAETGIMELQKVVGSVYEELVSAGSVKTDADKQNLAKVVGQLRDHFVDTLNASFGDRFVFAGYNTPGDFTSARSSDGAKPFVVENGILYLNGFDLSQFDKMPLSVFEATFKTAPTQPVYAGLLDPTTFPIDPLDPDYNEPEYQQYLQDMAVYENITIFQQLFSDVKSLDVGPGITMPITMNGIDLLLFTAQDEETGEAVIRNIFNVLHDVYLGVNGDDSVPTTPLGTDQLTKMIKTVQDSQNHLLSRTAEIGGRQRRLELLHARYEQDNLNYELMRSDAEDADMAEVIMYLKMAETVYQAALSAGARVIQPTLMDFRR